METHKISVRALIVYTPDPCSTDMWRLLRRSLVPAVVWLACLLCTLQLLAGFASDREGELVDSTHRLRPRHVGGEPEVRGRTYQRHGAEPLDARHRDLHRERLRLNRLARPHLVARRQIFSASSSQAGASDFIGRDREDSWPNVSCTTCSLVGYSGEYRLAQFQEVHVRPRNRTTGSTLKMCAANND
ncbi:hypothetical protein V5799_016369 [Amblyomma americanum]|uniref:Uncharacterized protein n=1 Tax=Amblyomma americanum TaxID=6943 RepID=A0AAQ4F5Y5_AMBAM